MLTWMMSDAGRELRDGYGVLGQSDEKEERVRIAVTMINLVRVCTPNEGQGR